MESIFNNILIFMLGILSLSFLVFIHELGHFLVAKWNKVKVRTFSIGFGKKLLKFKKGDTEYDLFNDGIHIDIVEKMRYILKHPYRFDNENEFRALLNLTDNNNIYNALAAYDSVYLSLR